MVPCISFHTSHQILGTCMNSTEFLEELGENKTVIEATPLRKNPIYINVYVTWMYFVFMYIIPFASLAVFNLLIFLAIRKQHFCRSFLMSRCNSKFRQSCVGLREAAS